VTEAGLKMKKKKTHFVIHLFIQQTLRTFHKEVQTEAFR
jgi:hypothetical protein